MKLELAPRHQEQSTCVIKWGQDSSTLTAFSLNADIRSQLFYLPVITTQLLSKTQQHSSVGSIRKYPFVLSYWCLQTNKLSQEAQL